jgi:hypothetical protein
MARVKGPAFPPKKVWRVSESVPSGQWVDVSAADSPTPSIKATLEAEVPTGWIVSSFDLLNGVDVCDEEVTVPGDLLDELFPPGAGAPKSGNGL